MACTLRSRCVALLLVAALVLATVPGVAAAETRSGGTVVVAEGETVDDDLTAFGGTVIVRGTVDGDLEAFAGNVFVEGEVTGNVEAFAGNVRIAGDVGGDVTGFGGNVVVEEAATIGGSLEAAGGTVLIAGSIEGDVEAGAGSITLASTATIGGDVEYGVDEEGDFVNDGATVEGTITRNDDIDTGATWDVGVPGWLFGVYGVLVNLLLGAVLLLVFPGFSRRVADRVAEEPLRTGAIGLLVLIGVPILLALIAITIVGIPLTILGAFLFALVVWVAAVYGRFAIGSWLVSLADVENRWAGLLVGVVGVAVVKLVPWIGGLVEFVVILLGLGALAALGRRTYRRRGRTDRQATLDESTGSAPRSR